MTPLILIAVPVLDRPHAVAPLVTSIREATRTPHRILFLCNAGDTAEIAACDATGCDVDVGPPQPRPGDWARKINHAYRSSVEPYLLLAADDLVFHPGWDVAALKLAEQGYGVVGTDDMGNGTVMRGDHATHPLVTRAYIDACGTADECGKVLHEGYRHNFCNPAEAPVWMADCTFRSIGDIVAGDRVVGWERLEAEASRVGTPRRALCESEVLAVGRRVAPLVKVTMESGRTLRCTPDHRWLNAAWSPGASHAAQFVTARVGRQLLHVVEEPAPVAVEDARTAGWIAGIYDGEGSGIYAATQSTIQHPELVTAISAALDRLAIKHSFQVRHSGIAEWVLTGGKQSYLEFLLRIAPVRRERLAAQILGWQPYGGARGDREPFGARRFGKNDRVVAVEETASGAEVISMTTTSGNYIAWGYCSRNCDVELVETAKARGAWAFAPDAKVEHLHPFWRKGADDATYRLGREGYAQDQALLAQRRRLWQRIAA